jgi:CBS domain-containing protein
MRSGPFTISETDTLGVAHAAMNRSRIRHLPVVSGGKLVRRIPARYRVDDVMTRPVVAVPFDQPLVELARHFTDDRVGALPVVDRFGALIGIISYVDALRVLTASR